MSKLRTARHELTATEAAEPIREWQTLRLRLALALALNFLQEQRKRARLRGAAVT